MTYRYRAAGALKFSPLRFLAVATAAMALMICTLAVLLADPGVSGASVIAESGAVQFESPPPLVSSATGESNTTLNFFTERTNFVLPTSTPIDITPGSFPTTYTGNSLLAPGTLAAGTAVDSYFMYSNPIGSSQSLYPYTATLTFSTPILGVIVTTSTLSATSASLGAPGTTYQTPGGLETRDGDTVELVAASTIHVEFHTSLDVDAIRIITAASPSGPGQGGSGTGPGGGAGRGDGCGGRRGLHRDRV